MIQLLGEYLSGIECTVYNVDADVLIVQTAIQISEEMLEDSYDMNLMYLKM